MPRDVCWHTQPCRAVLQAVDEDGIQANAAKVRIPKWQDASQMSLSAGEGEM